MGFDPATAAMIGSLGGPMLAAMFAPDGQELKSFDTAGNLSPIAMMAQSRDTATRLARALSERANTPIALPSAYVQQPGAYTGGGLAFPVGLVAQDPALKNPSLLNLPGMGEFETVFDSLPSPAPSMRGPGGDNTPPIDPGPPQASTGMPTASSASAFSDGGDLFGAGVYGGSSADGSGPRRRGFMDPSGVISTGDILNSNPLMPQGDDLHQAHGAVKLLMEALGNGDQNAIAQLFAREHAPSSYAM